MYENGFKRERPPRLEYPNCGSQKCVKFIRNVVAKNLVYFFKVKISIGEERPAIEIYTLKVRFYDDLISRLKVHSRISTTKNILKKVIFCCSILFDISVSERKRGI